MPPDLNLRSENVFSLLTGRDACSDAFGPEASNSECSPSLTLCCVRRGQQFPSCQQHLGKGWCCLGNNATDNCYVDQASVCDQQNSVRCTNLAEGVAEACCARLTSCAPGTKARKEHVRCNIQYPDLRRADQSEDEVGSTAGSSSGSMMTTSAVTVVSSTPTPDNTEAGADAGAAQTSLPPEESTAAPLPPALIGGAAVGATLGLVALVLLGYLFFRKQAKKKGRLQQQHQSGLGYPNQPPPPPPPTYAHSEHSQPQHHHHRPLGPPDYAYSEFCQSKTDAGYGYQPGPWNELPVDVMARDREPVELGSGR